MTHKNSIVNQRLTNPDWRRGFVNFIGDGWGAYNTFTSADVIADGGYGSDIFPATLSKRSRTDIISAALNDMVMRGELMKLSRGYFGWKY